MRTPPLPTLPPNKKKLPTLLEIRVKLQGITDLPKSGVRELSVKVGLQKVGSGRVEYKVSIFEVKKWSLDRGGEYQLEPGDYYIFIKGPKHIGKKVYEVYPKEDYPDSYHCCPGKSVYLEMERRYKFDFSHIVLLVRDLPE